MIRDHEDNSTSRSWNITIPSLQRPLAADANESASSACDYSCFHLLHMPTLPLQCALTAQIDWSTSFDCTQIYETGESCGFWPIGLTVPCERHMRVEQHVCESDYHCS